MPKMYSISKGEWVDVPESKVQESYASGDLVFAKGERVNVALPDGRYGSVLGEHFGEAVRAGAVYDLPSERQERAERAEYEGKNVEALLLAAGRGLTFGLSDVALEKMGAYTDEELQNIEEYNSVLSGVGEIGGMLLPAVLTGGASAAAGAGIKGAAKKVIAQTPAGYAARSAAAAEKGVAKLIGVEGAAGGSRLLRSAPGLVAAGGVEGALFGAGETFSEELLGRTDKTAEQIMGDITTSALLAGGLTAAFSAPAAVVAKAFQSQAKTKYPTGLAKKVADFKDKYTAGMTGLDTELLSKTRDPKFLDDVLGYKEIRDNLSIASRNHIGEMFDTVHGTTKSVADEKYRVILPKIKPRDEVETINAGIDVLNNYARILSEVTIGDDVTSGAAKKLIIEASKAKSDIVNLINKRTGSGATILDDGTVSLNLGILGPGSDGMAQEVFRIVDQLKIKQSRFDRGLTGFAGLRKFLEDPVFFGREAAESQAMLNSAWTKLIGHQKNFRKRFMTRDEAAGPGEPQFIADSNKINSFIDGLHAQDHRLHTKSQMFNDYVESFKTYIDAAKSVGLKIDDVAPNLVTAADNLKAKWSDFKYLQEAKRELEGLTRQPGLVSETFATIGGYALGGLPGALAARYIRNIAAPGDAVRRRITAHRMKSEINKQIDEWAINATNRVMGNITAPFKDLQVSKRASLLGLIGAKLTGDPQEDATQEIEALSTISDPSVLAIDPITGEQRVVVSDSDAANYARAQNAIMGPALAQLHTEVMSGPPTYETINFTQAANPILYERYKERYNEGLRQSVEKGEEITSDARETWARINKQPQVEARKIAALQSIYKNTEAAAGAPRQRQNAAALRDIANRAVSVTDRALT